MHFNVHEKFYPKREKKKKKKHCPSMDTREGVVRGPWVGRALTSSSKQRISRALLSISLWEFCGPEWW